MSPKTPNAGWYRDNAGAGERWWDGNRWTEQTRGGSAPPASSATSQSAPASQSGMRSDIAAAKRKMRVTLGAGREIKRLTNYLWEDETVEQMTTGTYGKGTGLVVLTDRRLLFVQDGMVSKTTEDFPIDKVSSVQWTSGLMLGQIIIFASGSKSEIKNLNKDDGKEIVDRIRHRLSAPAQRAPTTDSASAPSPAFPDPIEQLKKLAELRDAGVVTDAEFEAKKVELLGRL